MYSPVARHIDAICIGLEILEQRWLMESEGLMERRRRLFEPKYDYDQLSRSLSKSLNQLHRDWDFLKIFEESIFRCVVGEEIQSRVKKLDAVVVELRKDIYGRTTPSTLERYYMERPHELLSLLNECQRKTDELCNSEIRNALEDLSNFTFHMHDANHKSWIHFVRCVAHTLRLIADYGVINKQLRFLPNELEWIGRYLENVRGSLGDSHEEIHDFLTHVGSVVLRIAIQSCNFWFNITEPKIAEVTAAVLLDLQWEIDGTHPEFLRFNLRFKKVLQKIRSKTTPLDKSAFVDYFCSYLPIWEGEDDLKKELKSLIALYFSTTLKDGEDVQSFFAENEAVLGEAAFFLHSVQQESTFPLSLPYTELVTKLCLLKAEFFLKEQLNTSTSLMLFSENQFFKVDMFLTNLRAFTEYLCQKQNTEYLRQSSALAEELYNEVESLHISLQSERITNSLIKHSLLQLLFKIVFFKAESFLTELLKSSDTLISHEKYQIGALVEELKYFKRIITSKLASESSEEKIVISQVEAVVREMIFFSYSILPENDKFSKMIRLLPQLLDKVKIVKEKFREMIQQFPVSIFPKTYELGFIDFLGRNIRELLIYDPEWIAPLKHRVKEVQLHLEYLKSFLKTVKDSDFEQGGSKDLADHIIHVSYKLEHVLESIEVDDHLHQSLQQSVWLDDLLEDIRLVHEQVFETHEMPCAGKVQNLPLISCEMISRDTKPTVGEVVDDLGDEEVIIDRLIGGFSQRDVVSIVGMPGIGKTTLAQKVYNNQNVMYHFHRRAWCTVSQVYSKRELLLEILSDIHGLTLDIRGMTDDDLQAKLRQCLLKNRYLIVMDDVWEIKTWIDLQHSFPDDNNGSRILITSRLQDVALKIKPDRDPCSIRLLSDDKSWILLEKKTFKGQVCPEELLLVGKEIARHCQGLPLAVVAIAGLLQKTEKTQHKWRRISERLSSQIFNDPESRCAEILELSYKHLPEYLKACFLYLGVFLGEKDIPVSKMVRFWLAEGFIQKTNESKSLEDVAYDYLMELINRSLVIISKTRSNGKVKACRLHDLLRDLCHLKAKEENFLHIVTRNDEQYASFPDSDYEMEFDNSHLLVPVTFKCYRLGIYLKRSHFIDSAPSGLGIRSLLFFASADSDPKYPYDISFICQNFKLLRLLDLEAINMGVTFPIEIGLMVQLRYLAVSGYVRFIPPSIANLWRLETLVVKGLRGKVILPETIWSMTRLRHLHVGKHVAFELQGHEQVESSVHMENLVSFSTPSFSCGEDTMSILGRLPNLYKLRCILLESRDSSKNSNGFPTMEVLTQLESLKIIYYGKAPYSGELVFPLNLKKLTLSNFRLPWNHISRIGRLPNLEVLKLLAGAFEGRRWDMGEEEFKELKSLELDTLNIVEWNASCDPLPNLERLVLRNCEDLEKIPYDFAEINTLQTIEVQWCRPSVEESAKEIGGATGEIQIFITRS